MVDDGLGENGCVIVGLVPNRDVAKHVLGGDLKLVDTRLIVKEREKTFIPGFVGFSNNLPMCRSTIRSG